MKRTVLLPALLLASLACDRTLSRDRKTAYVPSEEGLTLIYEDPLLASSDRIRERLQMRVASARETPAGRRVAVTYSTLTSNQTLEFLSRDGGWVMLMGDTPLIQMLPEGFPERVDRWEDKRRGITFQVLGRGALLNPGLQLPEGSDRIGVWVEMETKDGAKRRIFFLPGIGEAESRILRNGQWVTVNQLVSRGFTEPPTEKPAP